MFASTSARESRIRNRLLVTTAVPALVASFGAVAHAGGLPTGGQVTGGSATINTPSATQMQITSTTSRSAISWQDFSIGSGYGVNVTQPNGGTQLESVRGTNVSQIFGSLTSNGSIVIANPNGIWFGPNAQVDVAGLAAVAAKPTDADVQNFIAGHSLNLSQAGNANAAIVNQGHITISNAGLAAFVAPGVRNDGIIQAKLGTVQLSSGTTATLDFYGDGLISIAVSGQTLAQAIDPSTGKPMNAAVGNTGTINADGGTVLITANTASNVVNDAINVAGVVQAQSVSQQNGQIVLDGGSNGNVQVAGTLDASGTGAGQTGGHIEAVGQTVTVASNAVLDASGDQGGGSIYVGGGVHGQGTTHVATTTTVAKGAILKANAVTNGNGGTVAVWSTQSTSFDGSIQAMGGAQGGNGGFVETSGAKLALGGDATVSTLAPHGKTGTWLLDPTTYDIEATGGNETGAAVVAQLDTNNVLIQADNTITVGDTIDSSAQSNSNTLTLEAPTVDLNAAITLGVNQALNGTATTVNVAATGRIQNGVDAAASGAQVNVAAGAFQGQVSIDKDLTLSGASTAGTTIAATNGLTPSFTTEVTFDGVEPVDAVIGATGGGHVTIENLTVDGRGLGGNDQFVGIGASNATLNVSGVHVTNIRNNPLGIGTGIQSGIGIGVFNEDNMARSVTLTGNTVDNFQKDGISLQGGSLTVDVENNTVTGAGATSAIGQNGIELLGFASSTYLNSTGVTGTIGGTVSGNVVSNIGYIPNSDYATPIYILGADGVTVQGNTVTGTGGNVSAFGISILGSTNVSVLDNVLSDLARGVSVGDEIDGSFFSNDSSIAISGGSIENGAIGVSVDPNYASNVTVSGVTFANNTIHYQGSGTGVATVANVLAGNTFDGTAVDSTNLPNTIYGSIQAAVDAETVSGATIDLLGTFTQQVLVDNGQTLTLAGTGGSNSDTTIEAPATLGTSFSTWVTFDGTENVAAVIGVTNNSNVTIQNLTVDGLSSGDNYAQFVGIGASNATLNVSGVHVTNIRNNPLGIGTGIQSGIGIGVFNEDNMARSVTLTGNTVDNFQKDGISLQGGSLTVDVENNTVTGSGATDIDHAGQNGIELLGFAGNQYITPAVSVTGTVGGTIGGNVVSNLGFASDSDYATPIYILGATGVTVQNNTVTGTGGSVSAFGISILGSSNVTVEGNTLSDLARGISVGDDIDGSFFPTTDSSITVTDNTIENNAVGIEVAAGSTGTQIGGGSSIGSTVGNLITDNGIGVLVASDAGTGTVLHWNSLAGNTTALENDSANLVDAAGNWWGTTSPTTADSEIASGGASTGDTYVDFNAMLASGTPAVTLTTGFDAIPSVIVHNLGASDGSTGRIQEGIDLAGPGGLTTYGYSTGVVTVLAGDYSTENPSVDVSLGTLIFSSGSTTIGGLNSVRADETEFDGSLNVTGSLTVGSAYFNGGDVNTAGNQTYSGGISLGADALIEAGGNIAFDGFSTDFSGHNLAALAQNNINVNGQVILAGNTGDLSLIAGWDGVTPLTGESAADIAALLAHTTTAGATYGQNGGSVTIGGSNGEANVASVNGTTTVAGYDVIVQGGNNSNEHAQIGYGFGSTTGTIDVLAVNNVEVLGGSGYGSYGQIGNGGLYAGDCCGGYAFGGDINVTAGNSVIVTGGHNDNAYAQIGNGGGYAFEGNSDLSSVSVSGNINVTATSGNVSLGGGNYLGAYAQIGHGGFNFASGAISSGSASLGGDITVSAGGTTGVSVTGGGGYGAYAQIGHGGQGAFQDATIGSSSGSLSVGGNISVTATNGNVSLYGGALTPPYAQIGHGGQSFAEGAWIADNATIDGDITVSAGGTTGVSVIGGTGPDTYAQIGHGGNAAFQSLYISSGSLSIGDTSANISVIASAGSVYLSGGSFEGSYAQIGHGGQDFASSGASAPTATIDGDILVSAGGTGGVTLVGDTGGGSYAQIGHGGSYAFGGAYFDSLKIGGTSANITVTATNTNGGDIVLFAGDGYAQIGNGGAGFASDSYGYSGEAITSVLLAGAIDVASNGGGVWLQGGYQFGSYAQIGHGGGDAFAYSDIGTLNVGNGQTITVNGYNYVNVVGGESSFAYAQIGNGGGEFASFSTLGTATVGGDVSVTSSNGYVFVEGGGASLDFPYDFGNSYAQVGNGGGFAFVGAGMTGALSVGGNITVTAGNDDVSVQGGYGFADYAQIGNGGASFGSAAPFIFSGPTAATSLGDVTLSGDVTVNANGPDGGVFVESAGNNSGYLFSYSQIGNGGSIAFFGTELNSLSVGGNVTVATTGNVNVSGGSDTTAGPSFGEYAQIGNGGYFFAFASSLDAPPAFNSTVDVTAGGTLSATFGSNFTNYAVIGDGDPIFEGVLAGTVDVTSVGDQTYESDAQGDSVILASGTYGTSGGTINLWDSTGAPTTVVLSGGITIVDSTTVWGPVSLGDGVTAPNMTFTNPSNGPRYDTTFTGDVGSASNPVGVMSVSGGDNFTIDNGVEVNVTGFTDSNMSGTLNFGTTLHSSGPVVLSGNFSGDIVCPGGGLSCLVLVPPASGTINGIAVSALLLLYGPNSDPANDTLHLFNIEYALSNPGQSLGGGGVNPQAGCSDAEKQANGGSCPAGSGDATTYGNQFLKGPTL